MTTGDIAKAALIRAPLQLVPLSVSVLSEIEIDFDIQCDIDRNDIPHARLKSPLLKCLNRILIQTKSDAAKHAQDVNRAVSLHDCLKNDRALIPRLPRFFRILRLDAGKNSRWRDTAAHAEWATTIAS